MPDRTARLPRPPGLPPGTLRLPPDADAPSIHVFGYGPDEFEELEVVDAAQLAAVRGRWPNVWINVNGLGSGERLRALGEAFGIHPLVVEDLSTPHQRPKVEQYPGHLYVVLRMLRWDADDHGLVGEQLNLVLGPDFVLTIQEMPGDPFDPVRDRLRNPQRQVRRTGVDFLAYAIIDAIVDHCFPMLEEFGDRLDDLESAVLARPTKDTLARIKEARRTLIRLRRAVWPMRDAVAALQGEHIALIAPETRPYLRDVFDHSLRVLDIAESYREQVGGLMDGYLSAISFRMNEVMGLLTLVGAVFLPLSFLTGLYGMNFDPASPWNMPELKNPFGYPILLFVMITSGAAMVWFFKKRGWFEFVALSKQLGDDD